MRALAAFPFQEKGGLGKDWLARQQRGAKQLPLFASNSISTTPSAKIGATSPPALTPAKA
jgi:hypothetical protein